MVVQGPLDDGGLVGDAPRIEPGAGSRQGRGASFEQGTGQGGGGRGVGDPHLATNEELAVCQAGALGGVTTRPQGQGELMLGHGRLLGEVGGARAQDLILDPGLRFQGQGGAEVDDLQLGPQGPSGDADGGATAGEVPDHLDGNGLGEGGDALRRHAVVADEDGDPDPVQVGMRGPLQGREAHGDGLQ